jgi:peptide/nickel transport system substrate-binding protein
MRVVAVISAALLAAGLSLGAASDGTSASAQGATFRVGIAASEIDSIDSALSGVAGTVTIFRATCAGLMGIRDKPLPEGLRVVPDLAASPPRITDGGKTYVFTLRKGLRFSTGQALTAVDVAHTINRVLRPEMKAYYARYLSDIVGARAVLQGRRTTASGVRASGRKVTIRLTRPLGDFNARLAVGACVVPTTVPVDPEGVKAPVPSAAPYYIAEYAPGRRIVLERNRFYRGARPHRVARIVIDLASDAATMLDRVERDDLDYAWLPNAEFGDRAAELKRRYGVGRSRFFSVPASFLRYLALNSARPLFRDNLRLRQAVNFALDRKALLRERGPLAGIETDQYLPPGMPGFRDARIYPLSGPDVDRARRLARGNLRGGRAVLYAFTGPTEAAQAQIVRRNLERIGLKVTVRSFPPPVVFEKVATPGESFDIALLGWLADIPDPSAFLDDLFNGRNAPGPNFSRFDSPRFNRALDRASSSTGAARYREYGRIDVDLARNGAPAVAYAYDTALTFVSARTSCIVVNPYLDLAAVCVR